MTKPKITTKRRNRVQLNFELPSLTQQAFINETNINNIMARYKKTGVLPSPTIWRFQPNI